MVNISKIINKNVLIAQEKLLKRNPVVFWPSDAGCCVNEIYHGECMKKIYWKIMGVPYTNPVNSRVKRVMDVGSLIEHNEIKYSKGSACIYVDNNIRFKYEMSPNIVISGEIDAIYVVDDIYYGIECKTGSGWYFRNSIFGSKTALGFPRAKDLLQVMIYLDYCKQTPSMLIDTFKLIYIDRGRCDTQEFDIKLSNDKKAIIDNELLSEFSIYDIRDTYENLQNYINTDTLPPNCYHNFYDKSTMKQMYIKKIITKNQYIKWMKTGGGMDYQCSYCMYLNRCLREDK